MTDSAEDKDPMIREPNVKRLLAAEMAQQDNIAL
jgi:hypothetical protein